MQNFFKTLSDKKLPLHHFYIIEGKKEDIEPELLKCLENRGIPTAGNPDLTVEHYESFTVDEGKLFRSRQNQKSFGEYPRIFIFSAEAFTREAEQALLKMFEEPEQDIHFFLIVNSLGSVADTIISRANVARKENYKGEPFVKDNFLQAVNFLNLKKADRLLEITKIVKSHDKDESGAPLRSNATELVNEIEQFLFSKKTPDKFTKDDVFIFQEISHSRELLQIRSASVKMILEHIAVIID